MKTVRIGTRKSPLAMAQALLIADLLRDRGISSEVVGIVTEGDRSAAKKTGTQKKLPGGKGVFVKALDDALLKKKIDLAVHSAKDVPSEIPAGLAIAAVPPREDTADLLVSRAGWNLATIPPGVQVGTASLRRSAQLKFIRPDVEILAIRGNVETRLAKIGKECDAALVAAAGIRRLGGDSVLKRLGLKSERLDPSEFLPAPGQGALMIMSRHEDAPDFSGLNDPATATAVEMERALVKSLGADCSWPVGVRIESGSQWSVEAAIFSVEGKLRVRDRLTGPPVAETAKQLAQQLLEKGGKKILEWNRNHA